MSDRYGGELVAAPCGQLEEVGLQGMAQIPGAMSRLAEHGSQLARASSGDMALHMAIAGLPGLWREARIATDVLGAFETSGVEEDREDGDRHEAAEARDAIQSLDRGTQRRVELCDSLFEQALELRDLLPHGLPDTAMGIHEARELPRLLHELLLELLPAALGAQGGACKLGTTGGAKHALHRDRFARGTGHEMT